MYNFIILLLILLLRIVPSFIGQYLTLDGEYDMYHVADALCIVLLALFTYNTIAWRNYYTKIISMLILVVSLFFTVNYMLVSSEESIIQVSE